MDKIGEMLMMVGVFGLVISFIPGVVDVKHVALRTIMLALTATGWAVSMLATPTVDIPTTAVARAAYIKAVEDSALSIVPKDWTAIQRTTFEDFALCEARTYTDGSLKILHAMVLQTGMGHSYELSSGAEFKLQKQVTFWKDRTILSPSEGTEVPPASAAAAMLAQCVTELKVYEANGRAVQAALKESLYPPPPRFVPQGSPSNWPAPPIPPK